MNTFELSLDLDKSMGAKQWITLRQGDKRGTTLRATLYDHGVLVSGSYTCRVSIRHPNRNTYYRETATYSNGVATVTIDETSAASVVGVTEGYFELLQGSTLIASTESFGVRILQSATDGATVGPPYDSAIEDALDELDAATGRISQMVVDATAEYLAAHPEITTTVQDNSVTDAKLIQSGGVLDRVGRLWWRLENLLTNTPAESESVTVGDAAKTPVAGLTVFGKSTQDGMPTPDAPVAIRSVTGNLLPNEMLTRTVSGVTFTHQEDGSIRAVGTSTAQILIRVAAITLPAGKYIVGPAPAGASNSTYFFNIDPAFSVDGVNINVTSVPYAGTSTVEKTYALNIYVRSGQTIDTTFYPCIYAGSTVCPYVPYDHVGLWAKGRNLFDASLLSESYYSVASDGKVTVLATDGAIWTQAAATPLAAGTYAISRSNASGRLMGQVIDASGEALTWVSMEDGVASTTFTAPASTASIRIKVGTGASSYPFTTTVQLEHGSTAHAYEPYAESVTAIPLDGHTLRSLPDGTRDEVTVDQYGHVTLVQRVGSATFDGSSDEAWEYQGAADSSLPNRHRIALAGLVDGTGVATNVAVGYLRCDRFKTVCDSYNGGGTYWGEIGVNARRTNSQQVLFQHGGESTAEWRTWLASNPVTIDYALATPVTHDLGTIDPTALVGPDLTAQAVPTAPFALTYERDLNATLARLEAALATLA